MKKLYAFLLFSLLFTFSAKAQLIDGSKIPAGLTLTDINGNVHVVQDYLDSGKAVSYTHLKDQMRTSGWSFDFKSRTPEKVESPAPYNHKDFV